MDTDDDERSKGKTVECGKANFNLKKKRYNKIFYFFVEKN
jgi:hypothetical protein